MDLRHTTKLWLPLRRRDDLRRDDLGFSHKLRDRQGDVLFRVQLFKCIDIHWLWIRDDQLALLMSASLIQKCFELRQYSTVGWSKAPSGGFCGESRC